MKAQKMTPNTDLKVAIVQSGRKQREIAMRAGIPEVRLSKIVTGRDKATADERRALSRTLHRPQGALFLAEAAAAS